MASASQQYDRYNRDPKSKAFYNSAGWKRCAAGKRAETPWCEECGNPVEHVHHKEPISTPAGWKARLDRAGLQSLCVECHNRLEGKIADPQHVAGMLDLVEDETWCFDAEAADRPVRFIEKYCKHFEGEFVGEPFLLHAVQKKIIRDVFGWKNRKTRLRRFNELYFEAAAGAGKSPLLAGLGLYGLMADGEAGAQVYSVASNYSQAKVVFDTAKRFIETSPELECRLKVIQYEILHKRSNSYWKIISGKGPKAGLKPSMVLGDELHEWSTREVYDSLQGRMTKRRQPLFICATNAGESRESLCWELHSEAVLVLEGKKKNHKLYPIIWAAAPKAKVDDPASWKDANRLLGITVKESKVREEWERASGDPALEARFERLYLSRWVQGANKWLDIARWDGCEGEIKPGAIEEAPLYVGMDLSLGDDLCAIDYVWLTPERFFVRSHFYIPRDVAARYEKKDQVPYSRWAKEGGITLLDELTVGPAVRRRIAKEVLETSKPFKLEAVCYDRYKADEAVAVLSAEDVKTIPIAQGWSVAPGCAELDRRLKDGSITIEPNGVLHWNAEIVEIRSDDRGNYWPVKPRAKGKYAGTRGRKIDGITALVTCLTEASKHNFPAAQKKWKGGVWVV